MFYWQMDRPFSEEETIKYFLLRQEKIGTAECIAAIEHGLRSIGRTGYEAEVAALSAVIDIGSVNSVVPAVLANGEEVILRCHPPLIANGYFWVEKLVSDTAHNAGIPTYRTLYIDDTYSQFPFAYMLCTKVPGTSVWKFDSLEEGVQRDLVRQTGTFAAKLHGIKTEKYGFFDNQCAKQDILIGLHDTFEQHFFAALDDNLRYLRDTQTINQDDEKRIRNIFQRHEREIHTNFPVLVHNDLADWNTVIDGSSITGIMDWDECISGDPVMEFAAYNLFFQVRKYDWFCEGYREIAALPEGYAQKLPLYKLRYVVSKAVGRRKKIAFKGMDMRKMLDLAIATMRELFTVL